MNTCRFCENPAKRILCGSVECARRYNAERSRETMRHRRGFYNSPRSRACEHCGETFELPRHGSAAKKRFCSRTCQSASFNARVGPSRRRTHKLAKFDGKGWVQRRAEAKIARAARGTTGTGVWISGTCGECGEAFTRHGAASPFCSKACSTRSKRRERRAREAGMKVTPVRRFRIHERDAWKCHICGDPVNRLALVPELDAPTLDHVIALAAGGAHHESNLKTAHFYCNSVKRELPLSQVA